MLWNIYQRIINRQNCRISRVGASGRYAIGIVHKIASGGVDRNKIADQLYLGKNAVVNIIEKVVEGDASNASVKDTDEGTKDFT